MVLVPYVLVPPLSPQKRPRSPSPASEPSSRSPSPNLSPRKRPRNDKLVGAAVSGISKFSLSSSTSQTAATSTSNDLDEEERVADIFAEPEDAYFHLYSAYPTDELELPECFKETGDEDDGKPIRRLTKFSIFRKDDDKPFVHPLCIEEESASAAFCAAGWATEERQETDGEYESDDESEPGEESRFVVLDIIAGGLNKHHFSDEELDENVYIETEAAYYILGVPAAEYAPFYRRFRLCHRIANSVLNTALEDPLADYARWLDAAVEQSGLEQTESALKRDDVVAYILQAIESVAGSFYKLRKARLIKHFSDENKSRKPEDGSIVVSDMVGRIIKQHLNSKIFVHGKELVEESKAVAKKLDQQHKRHLDDPKTIKPGPPSALDPKCYESVELDGVVYMKGDVVAVSPGADANKLRAKYADSANILCTNTLANNAWFVRIVCFYHDKKTDRIMFHGQWFQHSSQTILEETGHSVELLLIPECDDNPVASILEKVNVHTLEMDELEEPDDEKPSNRKFFLRMQYDPKYHSFSDLPTRERMDELRKRPDREQCANCAHEADQIALAETRVVGSGLSKFGHLIHARDFVYIMPEARTETLQLLHIARVKSVDLEKRELTVKYYVRAEDDSRRLYSSPRGNIVSMEDLDLDTRPFIRRFTPRKYTSSRIQHWIDDDEDHFYILNDEMTDDDEDEEKTPEDDRGEYVEDDDLEQCEECSAAHLARIEEAKRYKRKHGQVPVLEVFAGAGGLSQGFCKSGFFTTQHALEWSYPAAKTFEMNHPETTVHCTDINAMVRYLLQREEGKEQPPLRSLDPDKTPIPDEDIPPPRSVHVLCGGPPCQSFSRMNTHKKDDDPRSGLPMAMMSMAEIYQPEYFLLENVTGLLDHAEKSTVNGRPIERGMLKLLIRVMLALGYQVRPVLAQAGQHGCAQSRPRFFLFGARRGCVLPDAPLPTHVFKAAQRRKLLIEGDYLHGAKRGRIGPDSDPDNGHNFAPHAGITFTDACSDLPSFDWENPHQIMPETRRDEKEVERRVALGIKQCNPSKAPVGYPDKVSYKSEPQTRYQREMRRNHPRKVQYHVTCNHTDFVVEATVTIPFKPGASHKDLPTPFHARLSPKKTKRYGRLDADGPFKTAMTTVSPSSHGSQLVHPTEKRAISVLECKRAQGFPDHFKLWSDAASDGGKLRQYYKHIGNAVPVPLAAAVSRSFERAYLKTMSRRDHAEIEVGHEREKSPEL